MGRTQQSAICATHSSSVWSSVRCICVHSLLWSVRSRGRPRYVLDVVDLADPVQDEVLLGADEGPLPSLARVRIIRPVHGRMDPVRAGIPRCGGDLTERHLEALARLLLVLRPGRAIDETVQVLLGRRLVARSLYLTG